MQRKQFTFYRSFWDAMRNLPKREQLLFIRALCAYALDGEESTLSGSAAASAFCVVQPILDTGRRKAELAIANESKRKQTEICLTESASKKKDKD